MSRITKIATILGTVMALATVLTPAMWRVSHTQALTNVLLGQFAAMSIGHVAYRVAAGKRPSMRAAVAGVICGAGIAVSPVLLEPVAGFTTVTMVSGGIILVIGLYGIVSNMTTEDEQRIPDLTAEQPPEEGAKAA